MAQAVVTLESCRNLVHFICDFTKNDGFHFYLTALYISAFDTVQGRSFYSPVRRSFMLSHCCTMLLQIRTEKRSSVFFGRICLIVKHNICINSVFSLRRVLSHTPLPCPKGKSSGVTIFLFNRNSQPASVRRRSFPFNKISP